MLYHFSENGTIDSFVPRPSVSNPGEPSVVWAIDSEHAVHYYFPRDCPRIVYARSPRMTESDELAFFGHSAADKIITVESGWLSRIQSTMLYRYTFHPQAFRCKDATAGYYTSTHEVTPVSVEPMTDLIGHILEAGVELRFTPRLMPLRDALLDSSVDRFSVIRFRNAKV